MLVEIVIAEHIELLPVKSELVVDLAAIQEGNGRELVAAAHRIKRDP